jgi:hypothetical protein
LRGSKTSSGKLGLENSAPTPFQEWTPPMSVQSGSDREDEAIMTAIDLVADQSKTGEIGRVEVSLRRALTDDERANLREYAELAGVMIAFFPKRVDVAAGPHRLV